MYMWVCCQYSCCSFSCHVTGETEAHEISFTSSFDHTPNPHLEAVLAMQREVEKGEEVEGGEGGGGEVTLLHLMDDDDDD